MDKGNVAVIVACAFALGAILRDVAPERRPRPMARAPERTEKRLEIQKPVRETWSLTHPLSCPAGWVSNCPDFKPCASACL